jgi:hypothetical protein
MFITVFTTAPYLFLSWAKFIQFTPSYSSSWVILKFYIHRRVLFSSDLFTSDFPTKILDAFLFCPICSTRPSHFIPFDLIILIIFGDKYKWWSSSLCHLLHPVTSPQIYCSAPSSQTPLAYVLPLIWEWGTKIHTHVKQ